MSAQRPWLVIALWVVLLAGTGFMATRVGDVLTTEFALQNEPESMRADELLEDRLRGPEQAREMVIVQSDEHTVDDPAFRDFVGGLLGDVRGLGPSIGGATSFYESGDEALVSGDRHKTILPVFLTGDADEAADHVAPLVKLVNDAPADGFEVSTAGAGSIDRAFNEVTEKDLQRGEMFGIPIALVILLLVFGAAVAAGLPLVLAIAAILAATGTTAIIGQAFELNFLVVNMITMIGLAVGIDYSLFVVQRFREERARGYEKLDAIARTGATASRAVLFSGGTVIVGLAGVFVVPSNVYQSLAIGAIAAAVFAVLGALTLLPAVLSLLGDRVNALKVPFIGGARDPEAAGGFWDRVARTVMAHPVISVVATVALLAAAAVPYFNINAGLAGVSTLPPENEARQAFELLDSEFTGGLISPAEVVVDGDADSPEVRAAIARLREQLSRDPAFGAVSEETNDAGDLTLVSVLLTGDPNSDAAHEAIRRLRDDYVDSAFAGVDAEVLVTGTTAGAEDMFDTIDTYTPYVFAFVLGLSFVLLLVVFRSIVVPVKALVMNLLSVGAAYGLLVLVFQEGIGNEFFGFQQTDAIEAWLPLFLFSFLFGLSMDYHVFLLSRIRERFDQTRDNAASVAYGLRTTAGLITGAALIMVAVFSGFAMGDVAPMQQTGFGLAVAVILDATVIRTVLVPASMELLGDWNWYLPRWLSWLPEIRVEAGERRERTGHGFGLAAGGGD